MRRQRNSYPGQFLPGDSVIHRLPAGFKLAISLTVSGCALIASDARSAVGLSLLCATFYVVARLGWRPFTQDCLFVIWQAPVVVAVYAVLHGRQGVVPALVVSLRLGLFTLPTLWLERTTSPVILAASIGGILSERLAFLFSMTLRFLPILARDAREIYWLQRMRGARLSLRELANPLNWREACSCVAVPLLIRSFHLADHASVAARQRGITERRPGPHA